MVTELTENYSLAPLLQSATHANAKQGWQNIWVVRQSFVRALDNNKKLTRSHMAHHLRSIKGIVGSFVIHKGTIAKTPQKKISSSTRQHTNQVSHSGAEKNLHRKIRRPIRGETFINQRTFPIRPVENFKLQKQTFPKLTINVEYQNKD